MNEGIDLGKYSELYEGAKKQAQEYKIQSVPSFILNDNRKLSGIRDYKLFKEDFVESMEG